MLHPRPHRRRSVDVLHWRYPNRHCWHVQDILHLRKSGVRTCAPEDDVVKAFIPALSNSGRYSCRLRALRRRATRAGSRSTSAPGCAAPCARTTTCATPAATGCRARTTRIASWCARSAMSSPADLYGVSSPLTMTPTRIRQSLTRCLALRDDEHRRPTKNRFADKQASCPEYGGHSVSWFRPCAPLYAGFASRAMAAALCELAERH